MIFKKTIILILGISSSAIGMHISPTLMGLPKDLKKYLLPFVASGFPAFAAGNLTTFAAINKEFNGIANDEKTMLAFLEQYKDTALYDAYVTDLGARLSKRTITLSVMHHSQIVSWLNDVSGKLERGHILFLAASNNQICALLELLTNNKIDLNWKRSYFNDTAISKAIERGNVEAARLLLSAGASCSIAIKTILAQTGQSAPQ